MLLLFNGSKKQPHTKLSTSQIQKSTHLPADLLHDTLETLVASNQAMLKQAQTSTRKSAQESFYDFNDEFKPKTASLTLAVTSEQKSKQIV